jgi:hypothetical protein
VASTNAFALIHSDPAFNHILGYYRMFPQEVSPLSDDSGGPTTLAVSLPATAGRMGTFEGLVDALITHLNAGMDTFVVVMHGLASDPKTDFPTALGLTLAAGTQLHANDFFFKTMEDWRQRELTQEAARAEESKIGFGKARTHAPAGVLSRIHGKLITLRDLHVKRIEIRACHLAANPDFMTDVGTVLGTAFLTAPDVHMFYSHPITTAPPAHRPRTAKEFTDFLRHHPRARRFTGAASGALFAVEVVGKHARRTFPAATTGSSLNWFVDQFIMSGSNYPLTPPKATGLPTRFSMEGLDLPDNPSKPYALPLEAEFTSHIQKMRFGRTVKK